MKNVFETQDELKTNLEKLLSSIPGILIIPQDPEQVKTSCGQEINFYITRPLYEGMLETIDTTLRNNLPVHVNTLIKAQNSSSEPTESEGTYPCCILLIPMQNNSKTIVGIETNLKSEENEFACGSIQMVTF
jgi:hypothetical protein